MAMRLIIQNIPKENSENMKNMQKSFFRIMANEIRISLDMEKKIDNKRVIEIKNYIYL